MNREMKFRGKCTETNKWVYGYLAENKNSAFILSEEPDLEYSFFDKKVYKVIPKTVGQFTGLKDKNGKEIYEGDIVVDPSERIFHHLDDGEGFDVEDGIWIDKEVRKQEFLDGPTREALFAKEGFVVEWQNKLTGFFPFADHPENCGHCGGGIGSSLVEVVGNVFDNPELINE